MRAGLRHLVAAEHKRNARGMGTAQAARRNVAYLTSLLALHGAIVFGRSLFLTHSLHNCAQVTTRQYQRRDALIHLCSGAHVSAFGRTILVWKHSLDQLVCNGACAFSLTLMWQTQVSSRITTRRLPRNSLTHDRALLAAHFLARQTTAAGNAGWIKTRWQCMALASSLASPLPSFPCL
jgi:hypothetical protein